MFLNQINKWHIKCEWSERKDECEISKRGITERKKKIVAQVFVFMALRSNDERASKHEREWEQKKNGTSVCVSTFRNTLGGSCYRILRYLKDKKNLFFCCRFQLKIRVKFYRLIRNRCVKNEWKSNKNRAPSEKRRKRIHKKK